MKRALVLNGGGSRGAYQIGAWRAFEELGVRFSAVYGTSIGALNAALFAQGDLERAERIWENITVGQIVAVENEEHFAIDRMVSRKRDVIPFLVENARHLRMDIGPLEKLVRENIDEARIRARGMELGVMTFRVPQLQGAPVRLEDMAPGSLGDWIIASASCFPIFPERRIDGQLYIDGGYYDNLPVDLALAGGADEVVTVELHPEPTHPEYSRMPWLTSILPRRELGGFLDFNPDQLRVSRRLGYCDAMKALGGLDGFRYAFRPVRMLSVAPRARRVVGAMCRFDAELMGRGALNPNASAAAPLITALQRETDGGKLSWKDAWLRGVELVAEVMEFRVDAVYDAEALLRQAREYCRGQSFDPGFDEAGVAAAIQAGPRMLLAYLARRLESGEDFPAPLRRKLADYPGVTAAAMMLALDGQ